MQSSESQSKLPLYDNLGKDEVLALVVDTAVRSKAQDGWRSNAFKVKAVRNAIKAALNDDEARADQVLELVKNQNEY